jgi:riboflavin synthase
MDFFEEICIMFTGIIETLATVKEVISNGSNKTFWISCPLTNEFKTDQSISHSGVCLTVEEVKNSLYKVTAIQETLDKTTIGLWEPGTRINIERCLPMNGRLDGHFVQGHVDTTGICKTVTNKDGSWEFEFEFPASFAPLIIEKGSIAVNGISLTAFGVGKNNFTIAVIPYTYTHTNISDVRIGDTINLEFDLIGKYLVRRLSLQEKQ